MTNTNKVFQAEIGDEVTAMQVWCGRLFVATKQAVYEIYEDPCAAPILAHSRVDIKDITDAVPIQMTLRQIYANEVEARIDQNGI